MLLRPRLFHCLALLLSSHALGEELPPSVESFADLATESTWQETWPDASSPASKVTAKVWNAAIQAALAKNGAVHLPKRDQPYYLDRPIILKSGQKFHADREAEIRLKPHTNTCMIRNENVVGFADRPVPEDTQPDTDIHVEGGIWTTLSEGVNRSNGNLIGRSAVKDPVPGTHGVILLQNVRQFSVRDIIVRRSIAFAVHLANVSNFMVEGVRLEQHGRDGVHVNGPASSGFIREVSGTSHDDTVSLCAWDWLNCAPSFGPIHHIIVEEIHGASVGQRSADSIRLLPGVKRFKDGSTLACPVHDIAITDTHDIREFKLYDQPNLELGRDKDSSVELGELRNIKLKRLNFSRPGVIQVAANVNWLHIDEVELTFSPAAAFKLVELGPMSGTYKPNKEDPATWVEIFSPDRDVTVRDFSLTDVRLQGKEVPDTEARSRFVQVADQKLNPDYPKTTPRGGTGKVRVEHGE